MSTFAIRMIESTARKLEREGRILRNKAEQHPVESIRHFLLRRSWDLRGRAKAMLEYLGEE